MSYVAYCALEDVQAHRPHHPITDTSRPSKSEVLANIENLSRMVDGRVSAAGFLVPVTGQVSTEYLRAAVSWGVAGLAEMQQRAGIGQQDTAPRSVYWDLFQSMITAIETNSNILIDAPTTTDDALEGASGPVLASFFTKYPEDDPNTGQRDRLGETALPRFQIRQEF